MPHMSRLKFVIYANEPKRAAQFYTTVFGWKMIKTNLAIDKYIIMTGKGQPPCIILKRERHINPDTTVKIIISVPSVEIILKSVVANGGKILSKKNQQHNINHTIYCKDTEKNTFGISEEFDLLDLIAKIVNEHDTDLTKPIHHLINKYFNETDQIVDNPIKFYNEIPKEDKKLFSKIIIQNKDNLEIISTIVIILDLISRVVLK